MGGGSWLDERKSSLWGRLVGVAGFFCTRCAMTCPPCGILGLYLFMFLGMTGCGFRMMVRSEDDVDDGGVGDSEVRLMMGKKIDGLWCLTMRA